MTLVLVAQCLSLQLPQTQKLVLQSLANYVDADGIAFPGKDIIACEASVSERRLRPHIKALEEEGWIRILSVGNGRGQTTRYQLNVERIEEEYRKTLSDRKALRAKKGDVASSFEPWKKGDVAVVKGDAVVLKGDVAVVKGDSTEQLTVLPVTNRTNHVVSPKAPRVRVKIWEKPITEDGWKKLRERFPAIDVEEEALIANAHEARFKNSDEYLYLLNWMKSSKSNNTPRSAAGTGTQPSSAALHNPVPKNGFEDEKAEALAKFKAARAKGYA